MASAASSSGSSASAASGSASRPVAENSFLELCARLSLPRDLASSLNTLVNSQQFRDACVEAFEAADTDRSGRLESKEYNAVVQNLLEQFVDFLPYHDTTFSTDDVNAVLGAFDTSGDGTIDKGELQIAAKMLVLLRAYSDYKYQQAHREVISHLRVEGVVDAAPQAVWDRCGDFYSVSFLPHLISCDKLHTGERKIVLGNPASPSIIYERQDRPLARTAELPWKFAYGWTITNDPDPRVKPGTFKGNVLLFEHAGGKTMVVVDVTWVAPTAEDGEAVKAANKKFYEDAIVNVQRLFRAGGAGPAR